jgi:hypothetical protein
MIPLPVPVPVPGISKSYMGLAGKTDNMHHIHRLHDTVYASLDVSRSAALAISFKFWNSVLPVALHN